MAVGAAAEAVAEAWNRLTVTAATDAEALAAAADCARPISTAGASQGLLQSNLTLQEHGGSAALTGARLHTGSALVASS